MNVVLASGKAANRSVKIAEQGMAACLADLKVMTYFQIKTLSLIRWLKNIGDF